MTSLNIEFLKDEWNNEEGAYRGLLPLFSENLTFNPLEPSPHLVLLRYPPFDIIAAASGCDLFLRKPMKGVRPQHST